MSNWMTLPQNEPLNATDCWVRINYWFGAPFLAQWSTVNHEWTDNISGIVYPAWSISRWKYA